VSRSKRTAFEFITFVAAVVLAITHPTAIYTATVRAAKLIDRARWDDYKQSDERPLTHACRPPPHSTWCLTHRPQICWYFQINNKMQSQTADFASAATRWQSRPSNVVWHATGAVTWRSRRKIRIVFDSGLCAPLCNNMMSSTKPAVHKVLQCRHRRTCVKDTGNMYRKLGEIWTCGYWNMPADRKTNKHAYIQTMIAIRHNSHPYRGE